MTDRFEERLSEYLDGTLSAADERRVETHLAGCEACVRTLEELRAVASRAAVLPSPTPPRDLWPGIADRIDEPGPSEEDGRTGSPEVGRTGSPEVVPLGRRRLSVSVPQLAAAAVLLVSLSAGGAWVAARGGAGAPGATAGPAGGPGASPGAAFMAADGATDAAERYAAAIRDLEAALFDTESPLPPETAAKVRHSLLTIDRAIADARRALDAAPADPYVKQHLAATMRRKVDFLRSTVRLVTQS